MTHESLRIIRDEHSALAAMLRSLSMMVQQGPGDDAQQYFDVMRAMLFYIDEFPERLHHPKETELLFPRVAAAAPEVGMAIARLDRDHQYTEKAVRDIQAIEQCAEQQQRDRHDDRRRFRRRQHQADREHTGGTPAHPRLARTLPPPFGQVG